MIEHEHDDDEWRGGWDICGVRKHDGRGVSIRIGVIDHDGGEWVAIGVAGESPIALSERTASDAAELLGWAIDERELVEDSRLRRATAALRDSLDRAILTRRQWQAVHEVLRRAHTRDHPTDAAQGILRDAAPPAWDEPDGPA